MRRLLVFLLLLLLPALALAQPIPPSPSPRYIIDDAHILDPATLSSVNRELQAAERATGNQVVVALYKTMGPGNTDIATRAKAIFNAWGIGRKERNNGVLLIVFVNDHKVNITVGDGLRDRLPDATCQAIIDHDITPQFKAGKFDAGITLGTDAILKATQGQYQIASYFSRDTLRIWCIVLAIAFVIFCFIIQGMFEQAHAEGRAPFWAIACIGVAVVLTFVIDLIPSRRSRYYNSSGWFSDFGGGGGGGFSGGGGSSSGGGASGSW